MLTKDEVIQRLLNSTDGHKTFPYGQGSYDGDGCKVCPWQGPPNSGRAHTLETRKAAITYIINLIWKDDESGS